MQGKLSKYIKLKLILFFLLFLNINGFAQADEYLIKTSFILKFAKYTEWPQLNDEYFTVAVIGKNPFKSSFDKIASQKKIKGRKVIIKYIESTNEIKNANILFIPNSEKQKLLQILEATKNKPILLVSEIYKAANKGVHINFYLTRCQKVRFEINIESLKKSNLKISSLLINVAKII